MVLGAVWQPYMNLGLLLLQNDPSQCRSVLGTKFFAVEIMYNVSAFEHFIEAYFWHLGWNMAHNECVRASTGWAYKGELYRMGNQIGYNDLYTGIKLNGLRTYLIYMVGRYACIRYFNINYPQPSVRNDSIWDYD